MSQVVCLDTEHTLPADVQQAVAGTADRAAAILATGHCPACPDTALGAVTRTAARVCPCCWSAWWVLDGTVVCTPGAVVVEEPPAPVRR